MAQAAWRIVAAADVPVIADPDTEYGNAGPGAVARTDAAAVEGIDAVIDRALRYREAGAGADRGGRHAGPGYGRTAGRGGSARAEAGSGATGAVTPQ